MSFLGDVFYLSTAGQPIVVLNTQKVAADLLDRRAGIYSDRLRKSLREFSAVAWSLCFRTIGHCTLISHHIRLFLMTA